VEIERTEDEVNTNKGTGGRTTREVESDRKKFISVRVAARRAGLSHTTMYKWAQRGQTSNGTHIDVVKDSLTNQILISEDSIKELLQNRFQPLGPAPKHDTSDS